MEMISRKMAPALLLAALLMVVAALPPRGGVATAAMPCSTVYNALMPCLSYVESGGAVPAACCSGLRGLVSAARTTADRRSACACVKNIAAGAAAPYVSRAAELPARCGVNVPFKISPNVNCNAVN